MSPRTAKIVLIALATVGAGECFATDTVDAGKAARASSIPAVSAADIARIGFCYAKEDATSVSLARKSWPALNMSKSWCRRRRGALYPMVFTDPALRNAGNSRCVDLAGIRGWTVAAAVRRRDARENPAGMKVSVLLSGSDSLK
jgi:hypothetical protein